MEIKTNKDKVTFILKRDFNYLTAKRIENSVSDFSNVEICLDQSKIVDSEALISLYQMVKKDKHIIIRHPPEVIFEAIEILGIDELCKSGNIRIISRK